MNPIKDQNNFNLLVHALRTYMMYNSVHPELNTDMSKVGVAYLHLGKKSLADLTPKILFEILDTLCDMSTVDVGSYGFGFLESSFITRCKVIPYAIASLGISGPVRVYFAAASNLIPYEKTQINAGATFNVQTGHQFDCATENQLTAKFSFCPSDSYYGYLMTHPTVKDFASFLVFNDLALADESVIDIMASVDGRYSEWKHTPCLTN
jgi:hypothetical protein